MRHAKNFHSEWGYFTPTPSFIRTTRIVLLATAIGATAGGGVVLSLVDRRTAKHRWRRTPWHHLLWLRRRRSTRLRVHNCTSRLPSRVSPRNIQGPTGTWEVIYGPTATWEALPQASSSTTPITPGPAGISALAEVRPDDAPAKTMTAPPTTAAAPVENKATKKHHVATRYYAPRGLFGFVPGEHYTNGTSGGPYRDGRWGGLIRTVEAAIAPGGYSGGLGTARSGCDEEGAC